MFASTGLEASSNFKTTHDIQEIISCEALEISQTLGILRVSSHHTYTPTRFKAH